MYDRILIATDGSEPATAAAQHAVDLAVVTGATVHALFVVDTDTGWLTVSRADVKDSIREIGEGASREALQRVEPLATAAGVQLETAVRDGAPETEILAYAEAADVDLVVLGTHGHSALKRRLLGSVAERVINGADVPVTTIGVSSAAIRRTTNLRAMSRRMTNRPATGHRMTNPPAMSRRMTSPPATNRRLLDRMQLKFNNSNAITYQG